MNDVGRARKNPSNVMAPGVAPSRARAYHAKMDAKRGSTVRLPDGNEGEVVKVVGSGALVVRLNDGQEIGIQPDQVEVLDTEDEVEETEEEVEEDDAVEDEDEEVDTEES